MKRNFEIAATFYKEKQAPIEFVQVRCSESDQTKEFCDKHGATTFPTVLLFTGDAKLPFVHDIRTIDTFQQHFEAHLPNFPLLTAGKFAKSERPPAAIDIPVESPISTQAAESVEVDFDSLGEFAPVSVQQMGVLDPDGLQDEKSELQQLRARVEKLEQALRRMGQL